jgi:putative transposase
VDFKGWWYDRHRRCNPVTVRDEYTRYVLELRAVPDAKTETVQACFERLFERHGLPGVIRSDNGPPFACSHALLGSTRLSVWWLANGVDLERSRSGCPQDNGGHERMHRDIAGELEGSPYEERQAALETWRREFNEERPHEALGMKTPAEIYVHRPSLGEERRSRSSTRR